MGDPLTRAEALGWADAVRSARHRVREDLRSERLTLREVVDEAREDDLVARVKLLWVLESLPGAGKVATRRKLDQLGVGQSVRLGSIDDKTIDVLISEFPPTGGR